MEPGGSIHSPAPRHAAEAAEADKTKEDLVGEPYAVVESDPGSFIRFGLAVNMKVKWILIQAYSHLSYDGLVYRVSR